MKCITNPRYVKRQDAHHAIYFEGIHTVDENGVALPPVFASLPVVADKIAINHYRCKSREEFADKLRRGSATDYPINAELFEHFDNNDEFDDGILKYRAACAEKFSLESDAEKFSRVTEALIGNLSNDKISMETALTCRALSTHLRKNFPNDEEYWKICEENSLEAILKSLNGITFADAQMLIRELPSLLKLPYPAVKDIRRVALKQIIPQLMHVNRMKAQWQDYIELDYLKDILEE